MNLTILNLMEVQCDAGFNICMISYRPVKVIRLLARDTVEEIMYSRAVSKLQLTNTVIEDGRFSLLDQAQSAAGGLQVCEL